MVLGKLLSPVWADGNLDDALVVQLSYQTHRIRFTFRSSRLLQRNSLGSRFYPKDSQATRERIGFLIKGCNAVETFLRSQYMRQLKI